MNCGCQKYDKQLLVGRYAMEVGHDCASRGVRSSTLVLHPDGTYDQHVEFTNGKVVDEVGQAWSYDGHVRFNNFRIAPTGDLNKDAPKTEASLNVELSHPLVIRISPSSDCYYTRPM
jgi:hypothetical protein